jgi:hypothetical protein
MSRGHEVRWLGGACLLALLFAGSAPVDSRAAPPLPEPFTVKVMLEPATLPGPPEPFPVRVKLVRPRLPDPPTPFPITVMLERQEQSPGRGCNAIVGTWHWYNGATVNCGEGTCTASNGYSGSWSCTDPSGRFRIEWTGPKGEMFIDSVGVSGNRLEGSNQNGSRISATRR